MTREQGIGAPPSLHEDGLRADELRFQRRRHTDVGGAPVLPRLVVATLLVGAVLVVAFGVHEVNRRALESVAHPGTPATPRPATDVPARPAQSRDAGVSTRGVLYKCVGDDVPS